VRHAAGWRTQSGIRIAVICVSNDDALAMSGKRIAQARSLGRMAGATKKIFLQNVKFHGRVAIRGRRTAIRPPQANNI
jgi:hypothetical protein